MKVSLCLVHDGAMVVALDESARSALGGETVKVHRGESLRGIPYERLRDLGDGEHELEGNGVGTGSPVVQRETVDKEGPPLDGWTCVGFAVVACVLAAVLFGVFTWLEAEGGSVRIHWAVALAYYVGGKWGAVGLLLGVGGLSLLLGIGKLAGTFKDV